MREGGKWLPLDEEPVPAGTYIIERETMERGRRVQIVRYAPVSERIGNARYTSHLSTCERQKKRKATA